MLLVPSQVASKAARDHGHVISKPPRKKRHKERKARSKGIKERVKDSKEDASETNTADGPNFGRPGGRPNVSWLHVTEDDLRAHPRYVPLPPPTCVAPLQQWSDVSKFRQDSVQWGILHNGRLTTSRAAGALGILEPRAASFLGVPRGLRGSHKAARALDHLRGLVCFDTQDLEDASSCLVMPCKSEDEREGWHQDWKANLSAQREKCWREWGGDRSWRARTWSHTYKAWCKRRKNRGNFRGGGRVQMMWGSVHEATAVLCALNYFHNSGVHVAECGMFPGESILDDPNLSENTQQLELVKELLEIGVPIGASPDGLLYHEDGTVEVLEVKNHSPFRYSGRQGGTIIIDRDPPQELPPWYVPQVQLEMFCVGSHCRSAVFVRLTATRGASVVRVPRDDGYISAMLSRFIQFVKRFLLSGVDSCELEPNFGDRKADGSDQKEEMNAFLRHTLSVSASAEPLGLISHSQVQRKRPGNVPLLL